MNIQIGLHTTIKNSEPLTITIGNFDGLHLGHQALIKQIKAYKDTKSAILTFEPHPKKVLRDVGFKKLMSAEKRIETIKQFKVDKAFIVKFTKKFANTSPDDFIMFLKSLNVKRVVVGKDYRFGAFAKGSVSDLEKHFDVCIVDNVVKNQMRVSTSYIKDLIETGDLALAEKMLTRPYQITGVVIDGDKVGRTLGIPTANLNVNDYVLPPNGVYFVTVEHNNTLYAGALNIGYNPTINYSVNKRTEVHILDFNSKIYGEELKITFYKYLRPEQKFNNREELIKTINNDILICKNLFAEVVKQEIKL